MHTPISAIIVTLNEGQQLLRTVEHFERSLPADSEIIVVDDGSTDGSVPAVAGRDRVRIVTTDHVGVARGRNAGGEVARHDVLVFADAHITMEPDCWTPLLDMVADPAVGAVMPTFSDMSKPKLIGYGMYFGGWDLSSTWFVDRPAGPVAVPLLAWGCSMMRRELFVATGGFDRGMLQWGSIDNEMSVRLWLEGFELRAVPTVMVSHLFRNDRPYPITWGPTMHNRLRLAMVHFEGDYRKYVVDALKESPGFSAAVALLAESDVPARRRALAPRRKYDSRWLVEKFLALSQGRQ